VPIYSLSGENLLGLQDFTAHVNLNFVRGAQLHGPRGILIGTGKLVRHVTFRSVADIDCGALKDLIDQAIIALTLLFGTHVPPQRGTMNLLEGIYAKRSDVFAMGLTQQRNSRGLA